MDQKIIPSQKMVIKPSSSPSVKSNCLICNEEREFKCGLKENETFPVLFNKMWTAFVKYFDLNPSKWEDILTFYNHVKELPFCDKCRNDVAQLLVFHERVESFLSKIRRLTTNISAKIISSQKTNHANKNTASDSSTQTVANVEKTNSQLYKLRKHIIQRFDPQVTLTNDEHVDSKLKEMWNGDEEEEDNMYYNEDSNSLMSDSEYDDFEEGLVEGDDNDEDGGLDYGEEEDGAGVNDDIEEMEEEGDVDDDQIEEDNDAKEEQEQPDVPANRICQICKMTFSRPGNLKRHCWKIHRKKIHFPRKQKQPQPDPDGLLKSIPVIEMGDENFEYAGFPFKNTDTGYQCKTCDGEVKRHALAHILCHIRDEHIGLEGGTGQRYETAKYLGNGNYSYLEKWLFTRTADGFFICSTCDCVKNSRKNMVLHIKMIHAKDTTNYCRLCDRGFGSRDSYHRHKRSHKQHRYYQKPGDPDTYIYDGTLEFVRVGDEFQCSTCKIFKNERFTMAKHVRDRHIEPEMCKCMNCERQFRDRGSLRKHLRTKVCLESKWHFVPNSETGEKDWYYDGKWPVGFIGGAEFNDPECRYICKECGQSRKEKTALATHIKQMHITPFSYVCEIPTCARRFLSPHYLNLHMDRFHSDGDQFKCGNCGKGFSVKRNLTLHIRKYHTPGREKPCPKGKRGPRKQIFNIMDIPSTSSDSSRSQNIFIKEEPTTAQNEMNDMLQIIPTPNNNNNNNNNVEIEIDDSSNFSHFINQIKTEDATAVTSTSTFENPERDPLEFLSGERNTLGENEDTKYFSGISRDPLSINQDEVVDVDPWTTFTVLNSPFNEPQFNTESHGANHQDSLSILSVKSLHPEQQARGEEMQSSSRRTSRKTDRRPSYSEQEEIIILD